ncbi:cyclic nucleotide-binding protein [Sphingomonas sp. DBB INV C78]|uniref:Crp/Fnr family transcriptional regulator n=1 Tax=Sphingomonas sp. DBB INV C78 TaxID=3349434 RepID=UPI0036D2294F
MNLLNGYASAFKPLPEALRVELDPHLTQVRARAGQTILALGASSTSVYLVLEGRVQVAIYSLGGREIILRNLSVGAMFGELAAIDERPRSASIVALDPSVLASIPGAIFRKCVSASPDAALWMMQRLSSQVRDLTDKILERNALRVTGRLHCELLRLCGSNHSGREHVEISGFPTHAELASRIGTNREAVSREMSYLQQQGVASKRSEKTMVIDLSALTALAQQSAGDFAAHILASAIDQAKSD